MNPERVSIEIEAGVADVRLVRADKHNALDQDDVPLDLAMRRSSCGPTPASASSSSPARGPSFCSGLDLAAVATGAVSIPACSIDRPQGEVANLAQTASYGWRDAADPGHRRGARQLLRRRPADRARRRHPHRRAGRAALGDGGQAGASCPTWAITRDAAAARRAIDVAKELTFTGRIVDGDRGGGARPRHPRRRRPAWPPRWSSRAEIAGALARSDPRRSSASSTRPGSAGRGDA